MRFLLQLKNICTKKNQYLVEKSNRFWKLLLNERAKIGEKKAAEVNLKTTRGVVRLFLSQIFPPEGEGVTTTAPGQL